MPEDEPAQPASEPPSGATAEPLHLKPGQGVFQLDERGITAVALSAVVKYTAPPEVVNTMVREWLTKENPALLDDLIKERLDALVAHKAHLHVVRDPATIKRIARSKGGKA